MKKSFLAEIITKAFLIFSLSLAFGIGYLMIFSSKFPLHSQEKPKYKEINLKIAKERFDEGILFVDARSSISYNEGHIKGAISFPAGEFLQRITDFEKKYPKETKMVVYCSGVGCSTSFFLGERLIERGYKNVEIFFGGWNQWLSTGYPIEKVQ
ncbi:MAG: rhodanese-like domain-containing protein [Candidatus Aminicenantia bacterium]